MKEYFFLLFQILFVSGIAWLALCNWLFLMLKKRHPAKYESMGSPTLFKNNNMNTGIKFIKFLFRREWKSLNDRNLSALSILMTLFLIAYSFGFIALLCMQSGFLTAKK